MLPGKAESNVVLRQQDVCNQPPQIGLVLANPEELWRREAGERVVPSDGDQPLLPHYLPDQVALGGGALIVP